MEAYQAENREEIRKLNDKMSVVGLAEPHHPSQVLSGGGDSKKISKIYSSGELNQLRDYDCQLWRVLLQFEFLSVVLFFPFLFNIQEFPFNFPSFVRGTDLEYLFHSLISVLTFPEIGRSCV